MKKIGIILIVLMFISFGINVYYLCRSRVSPCVEVRLEQPEFFLSDVPDSSVVLEALIYYHVKHPDIVLRQAILETGNFRSNACIVNNNLFGLYNSKTGRYFRFKHWTESVKAYIKYIQYRYVPEKYDTYYDFLDEIGYAEDPIYNDKLRRMAVK